MNVKFAYLHALKKINHKGEILVNESLGKHTTYHTGGKCRCIIKIATLENFIKVMMYISSHSIPYFVLGGGSNVLVSDAGYDGIIIKLVGDLARIEMQGDVLECGAGVTLSQAYVYARDLGLSGLECSAGIPATIGGATYMNAQAYGFEMSSIVDYVIAFCDGKIRYFSNTDCQYSYRKSIFMENQAIILRVGLKLEKLDTSTIQSRYLETITKRKHSQPLQYGSAGCVFKKLHGLEVSRMLDEMGIKGMRVGGAMVSNMHANFIINYENATSTDIYHLIKIIKKQFTEKYSMDLELEIKLLGEFE